MTLAQYPGKFLYTVACAPCITKVFFASIIIAMVTVPTATEVSAQKAEGAQNAQHTFMDKIVKPIHVELIYYRAQNALAMVSVEQLLTPLQEKPPHPANVIRAGSGMYVIGKHVLLFLVNMEVSAYYRLMETVAIAVKAFLECGAKIACFHLRR